MIDWREIHWPRPLPTPPALGLLLRLASDRQRGPLVWEARAEADQIRYLVGATPRDLADTATLIPSLVTGTALTELSSPRKEVERSGVIRIRQRSLGLALTDPEQLLRALLAALTDARGAGDVLVMQIILGRAVPPELLPRHPKDPTQTVWSKLMHGSRPVGTETRTRMRSKLEQYRFCAIVRIGVSANSSAQRMVLVQRVLAALRQLQSGGTQVDLVVARPERVDEGTPPTRLPLRLTPEEALAFLAWPGGTEELPGLPALHPRLLAPSAAYTPIPGRAFAVTTAPGVLLPIGIGIDDACRHTHIVGPTGTGKSNLLLHLIAADIKAGRSLVLIDPKRDLAMDVLALIPESRYSDVVVIDPTMSRPVGLNPLPTSEERRALVADSVLTIFKGLFPSAFGPRTSDVMHASLLTLMSAPGSTLVQLPALLTDPAFRRTLTARLDDPIGLGSFWAQWEAMSSGQQAAAIGPVMSRLRQFLLRPQLRAVLDQPTPRFRLEEIFTQRRIVIVTLNKGLLGSQSASLLGSLIVSQIWQLTLARAALPHTARHPVSVFVDEAQNFLHLGSDLGEALEQSRSLKVAWHLAHQYRRQMPPDLLASIDANARNKIAFTLDSADAAAVADGKHLVAEDFTGLPPYEIYASLLSGGRQTGWMSGRTLPPPAQISSPEVVITVSQARYGADIEPTPPATPMAPVTAVVDGDLSDEPIGRTRRGNS